MAKRLSPGSDGSDAEDSQPGFDDHEAKRRRLVEFEPICLKNVTSVAALHDKQFIVASYKVAELLRYKTKVIAEKEREIERLRQKQITDENTSCTINRHWNNLEEQVRMIVLRGANPEEANKLFEELSNGEDSAHFLEEIVQLDDCEREKTYDRRVQWSVRVVKQLLQQIGANADFLRLFSKKMEGQLEGLRASGTTCPDAIAELHHKLTVIAEGNSKVAKESCKLQLHVSNVNLKLKDAEDSVARCQTRIEELTKELDDTRHDLEKSRRQVVKLDFRLYKLAQEGVCQTPHQVVEGNGSVAAAADSSQQQQNGVSSVGENDSQELLNLRTECEVQSELAANRLNEIKELNERIKKLVEEVERANFETKQILENDSRDAKEFEELKSYFSLALDELSRVKEEHKTVVEERELIRQEMLRIVDEMKANEQEVMKAVLAEKEVLALENTRLRNELEQCAHERKLEERKSSVAADVEIIDQAMKSQITQLRCENSRLKKKWKDSVNILAKVQKDLEMERLKFQNSVIIDLDSEIEDEFVTEDGQQVLEETNDIDQLKDLVGNLRCQLEVVKSWPPPDRETTEILASEKYLKSLNARLRRHICRMTNMERKERLRHLEVELRRQLEIKEHDLQMLQKTVEDKTSTLDAMYNEMETTGQALDNLVEQNTELTRKNKAYEDERMQMMGERITATQSYQKLTDERNYLEQQLIKVKKQLDLQSNELQGLRESLAIQKEAMATKTEENLKVTRMLEGLRKQVMDLSRESSTLKNSNDKMAEQLKSLQETVISKAQQHEVNVQKNKRLEEQVVALRKRLERARKSEKLGSTDAVLLEELRTLKEQLTCPSCQVNKKDAILTKCFHVFCLDCLQTRYNTRQRKCPKCNANFGANDFQRAYIT